MLPEGQRYCPAHLPKAQQKYHAYTSLYERGRRDRDADCRAFYASSDWRQVRAAVLAEQPLCSECGKAFASQVHHVLPLKTHWELRLDKGNLRGTCASCHSRLELTEKNNSRKGN